jgi:hypothetical protein
MDFFNSNPQPQQQIQQEKPQQKKFSNDENINSFCEKFFANAGPNYRNTPTDFIKLAFCNIGLLQQMLKSPEIKEIDNMANTAMSKGLISKDTLNGFSKVLNLFK